MTTVRLHYWAGAKAAAGVELEEVAADSVGAALEQARSRRGPEFGRVLSVSSVLVDGVVADRAALDRVVSDPVTAEILPPFAGGSGSRGRVGEACRTSPVHHSGTRIAE
jgi:molybdopterin converting factor small subunit